MTEHNYQPDETKMTSLEGLTEELWQWLRYHGHYSIKVEGWGVGATWDVEGVFYNDTIAYSRGQTLYKHLLKVFKAMRAHHANSGRAAGGGR